MKRIFFTIALALSTSFIYANTLIAYYSFTGNCKSIVSTLSEQITADILEIQPFEEGIDYAANGYSVGSDLIDAINSNPNQEGSYPKIKDVNVDLSKYNNIIIVTPLWWSHMAAPMQTFLFKYGSQMSGKNVGVIIKSSSSSAGTVFNDAKRLIPNATFMSKYLWLSDSNFSNRSNLISQWLKDIDFTDNATQNWSMTITCQGRTIEATMYDNATTRAIKERLPLTLNMLDLYGREMTYRFPDALPTDDVNDCGFEKGEIIYYPPMHSFVIMYAKDDEEFEMQKLGYVTNTSDVDFMKGLGDTEMTFSVSPTGIEAVKTNDGNHSKAIYSISGQRLSNINGKGIYIENGIKKTK